jgi:hypothetical protein
MELKQASVDCDRETRAMVIMAAGFILRGAEFISW